MASASSNSQVKPGETGGAAFGTSHSVFPLVSRLNFRRFSATGVVLDRAGTPGFVNLALAVTGMTSSSATRWVNLDNRFVFGSLRHGPGRPLWNGLLDRFLASQPLLFRRL